MPPPVYRIPPKRGPLETIQQIVPQVVPPIVLQPPEPWRWFQATRHVRQTPRTFQPDPRTADQGAQPRFPLPPPAPWRWALDTRAVYRSTFQPDPRTATDQRTVYGTAVPLIYEQRWPLLRSYGLRVFENPLAAVPLIISVRTPEPWRWTGVVPPGGLPLPPVSAANTGTVSGSGIPLIYEQRWPLLRALGMGLFVPPTPALQTDTPSLGPPDAWRWQVLVRPPWASLLFDNPAAVPVPLTAGLPLPEPWRWQTMPRAQWASLLFDNPVPALQTDTPGLGPPEPWRWIVIPRPPRLVDVLAGVTAADTGMVSSRAIPLLYEQRWPLRRPLGGGLFDNPPPALQTDVFPYPPPDTRHWRWTAPPPIRPDLAQLIVVVDTDLWAPLPPPPWRWQVAWQPIQAFPFPRTPSPDMPLPVNPMPEPWRWIVIPRPPALTARTDGVTPPPTQTDVFPFSPPPAWRWDQLRQSGVHRYFVWDPSFGSSIIVVVAGDGSILSIDLPELGATIILGGGGMGGMN